MLFSGDKRQAGGDGEEAEGSQRGDHDDQERLPGHDQDIPGTWPREYCKSLKYGVNII